jgi:hypothetical protein
LAELFLIVSNGLLDLSLVLLLASSLFLGLPLLAFDFCKSIRFLDLLDESGR